MHLSIADIKKIIDAKSSFAGASEVCATGVSIDSRKVKPGDVFICMQGEHFDGHSYPLQAVQSGAVAIIAERELPDKITAEIQNTAPVFYVEDSKVALGKMAAFWRSQTNAFVIGITGTAGKTTVKEILASILARTGKIAKNQLNLNNQIGMPLSILNADGDEKFWIMEAGISQPHDMDELGEILKPNLALVLNAGAGHLAGLGVKGTAYHKSRFFAHLAPDGVGLVCADYPDLVREARAVCRNLVFFSALNKQVLYRAAYTGQCNQGRGLYRIVLDGNFFDVDAPFCGRYGAENTIAIAAAAHLCGIEPKEILKGFSQSDLPQQRCNSIMYGNLHVIDDSYNANPLSMERMLEAASELSGGRPLICMLGEMGELGDSAEEEHEKLGRILGRVRPKAIFWRGNYFEAIKIGLKLEGYNNHPTKVENAEDFCGLFCQLNIDNGVIIFKASRLNGLENYVKALTTHFESNGLKAKVNKAEAGNVL